MKIVVSLYNDDEIIVFTETKYYQYIDGNFASYYEAKYRDSVEQILDWLNTDGKKYYKFYTVIEVDGQLNLLNQIKEKLPEVFL